MLMISPTRLKFAVMLTLAFTANAALSEQSDIIHETGAAPRIETADQMRTLSQTVASSLCHLHNGLRTEQNQDMLLASVAAFDDRLNALANGDADHGIIGAETNSKVIRDIATIQQEWDEVRTATQALLQNPDDFDAIGVVYADVEHVLDATTKLLATLSGEYANPVELLQSDVILMDVVGQQSMRTQRIAYEACKVWSGTAEDGQVDDLQTIVTQFEIALFALHDGMPAAGVTPAPTPEIAMILEQAVSNWEDVKVITAKLLAGDTTTITENETLFDMMNEKTLVMEEVTHLYELYARRTLN